MTENWWFQLLIRGLGIFGVAMTVVDFQCKKHSLVLGDANRKRISLCATICAARWIRRSYHEYG